MEAWNGAHVVSDRRSGMRPRAIPREMPVAGPAIARNVNLGAETE